MDALSLSVSLGSYLKIGTFNEVPINNRTLHRANKISMFGVQAKLDNLGLSFGHPILCGNCPSRPYPNGKL